VESTPDKGTVMTVSLPSVPTLAPAGDE